MSDRVDAMIDYLDKIAALAENYEVPAYAESCRCGGSITIGKDTSMAERRRMWGAFVAQHSECPPVAVEEDGDE